MNKAGKQEKPNISSFSEDLLEHLDEIPDECRKKWPKDMLALIALFQRALKRHGIDEKQACGFAHVLLAELADYCGGRNIYIPRGEKLKRAIRDVDLFRDFNDHGMKVKELAIKYKITMQHVYRIINEQRAIRTSRSA